MPDEPHGDAVDPAGSGLEPHVDDPALNSDDSDAQRTSGARVDAEDEPERRRRTKYDKNSLSIVAALMVAILGFAITVQIRQDDSVQDFSNVRGADLAEILKSIDATNQRLAAQIEELTSTRNELQTNSSNSESAEKAARERADAMAILSGSVGAKGPGIQITVTAPDEGITSSVLLDAIQEMRDAGAEAMVINGVARVVAHTWFADDEAGVRVGGRILQPPFVIEVIGDPHTLDKAVQFRGGLTDRVESRGGTVDVAKRKTISITALADELEGQYARPAK